jgi:hypothetical protein
MPSTVEYWDSQKGERSGLRRTPETGRTTMIWVIAKTLLGFLANRNRIFKSLEIPKMNSWTCTYDRPPRLRMRVPAHANNAAGVVHGRGSVQGVYASIGAAKVFQSVVRAITIFVVNLIRPLVIVHRPNYTMCEVIPPQQAADQVPVRRHAVHSDGVRMARVETAHVMRSREAAGVGKPVDAARPPRQNASVGMKSQQFVENCGTKLRLSHVVLLSRSVWSGPDAVLVTLSGPLTMAELGFSSNEIRGGRIAILS